MLRYCVLRALWACLLPAAPCAADTWQVYKNCSLVPNPYNDGDSFHVKTKGHEYVFRLYFVDAAETEMSIPSRVEQQAAYWGIGTNEALGLAAEATEFTEQFLQDRFTVYTKKEDARGGGGSKRYFAMIKADGRYLCEVLVEAGLTRVYGMRTSLPDGTSGDKYFADLRVLEKQAKREGLGGWRKEGLAERDEPLTGPRACDVTRTTAVYSLGEPPSTLGLIHRGARVEVVGSISATMVKIKFKDGEREREGQCRRSSLDL